MARGRRAEVCYVLDRGPYGRSRLDLSPPVAEAVGLSQREGRGEFVIVPVR